MAEIVVRCPYCSQAPDFGPMLQRPDWIICEKCGHVVIHDEPDFKCSCRNCLKRAA
jgi:hypothetical protein